MQPGRVTVNTLPDDVLLLIFYSIEWHMAIKIEQCMPVDCDISVWHILKE
jgi:hypothetical protein